MKNYAIILAAGDGKRIGSKIPKCFIKIRGKELYKFSLETFLSVKKINKVVLVVPPGYKNKVDITHKKLVITEGGKTRNESFEKGMSLLKDKAKPLHKILIHDAARAHVSIDDINLCLKSQLDYGTLAYLGPKNNVDFRIKNYNILTPQFVRFWLYKFADEKNQNGKDLISYLNVIPQDENFILIKDFKHDFKATFKSDLKHI